LLCLYYVIYSYFFCVGVQEGNDGFGETVKQIFVNGELVTTETIQAKDADINEALDGIL